jgi:hypothetical protein
MFSWILTSSLVSINRKKIRFNYLRYVIDIMPLKSSEYLTRKCTSNHPPNPHNFVFSMVIDRENLDLTFSISATVAVKQSISLIIPAVPMT